MSLFRRRTIPAQAPAPSAEHLTPTTPEAEAYSRPGSEHRSVLSSDGTCAMDAGPAEFKDR